MRAKTQDEAHLCQLLYDMFKLYPLTVSRIKEIRKQFQVNITDAHGRVLPFLQDTLYEIERDIVNNHLEEKLVFETYQQFIADIGARMEAKFDFPLNDTPYWLDHPQTKLDNYSSSEILPSHFDVVIIGCGLTGAAAAYFSSVYKSSEKIAVFDKAHLPAFGSSGRNGGNFDVITESCVGDEYQGLVNERLASLKKDLPKYAKDASSELAERQARALVNLGFSNSDSMNEIIDNLNIDCDNTSSGWLKIANHPKDISAFEQDIKLLEQFGTQVSLKDPESVFNEYDLKVSLPSLFSPKGGKYHPFKFVNGIFEALVEQNKISLYLNSRVSKVENVDGIVELHIERNGKTEVTRTKKLIVATNAFFGDLFPDYPIIEEYQSQIVNMTHVECGIEEMAVTENACMYYYNFPKASQYRSDCLRGTLQLGGGEDVRQNHHARAELRNVMYNLCDKIYERFPSTKGQPPSCFWTGKMGFTKDHMPYIGKLGVGKMKDVIVAIGFNGFGGAACNQAGKIAAEICFKDQTAFPDAELFAPDRFLHE